MPFKVIRRLLCVPLLSLGLALGQALPALADVVFNQDIPIAGTLTNPCNGDVFGFSGTLHVVIHETIDSSGGFHFGEMINTLDTKSVAPAVPSGSNYVVSETVSFTLNITSGAATEFTEIVNFHEISSGPAPNFLVHVTIHVTVVNGVPTAQVTDIREECTP